MVGQTVSAVEMGCGLEKFAKAGRAKAGEQPRALVSQIAAMVEKVCCDFASTMDWQYRSTSRTFSSRQDGNGAVICFAVTENEDGLHSGSYIRLSVLPAEDRLEVKGGCHDAYYQPVTVCEKHLPLNGLTQQKLGDAFMETYVRLVRYHRTHVA
jgi:hypothetical protein